MVQLAENGIDALMADDGLRSSAEGALREAFPAGMPLGALRRGMERPNPALANAWRACIDFSTKDRLTQLRCPVLVAHGTADALIPFRAGELVARAIPGAAWIVEEGAGHSLPQERAPSFAAALVSFLRTVDQRSASASAP
jgi:pimeloyl-ACP methyl ester carboxylesterase